MKDCSNCIHESVCKYKNEYLTKIKDILGKQPVREHPENEIFNIELVCKYYAKGIQFQERRIELV